MQPQAHGRYGHAMTGGNEVSMEDSRVFSPTNIEDQEAQFINAGIKDNAFKGSSKPPIEEVII